MSSSFIIISRSLNASSLFYLTIDRLILNESTQILFLFEAELAFIHFLQSNLDDMIHSLYQSLLLQFIWDLGNWKRKIKKHILHCIELEWSSRLAVRLFYFYSYFTFILVSIKWKELNILLSSVLVLIFNGLKQWQKRIDAEMPEQNTTNIKLKWLKDTC